jgi:hypothetical protein
MRVSAQQARLIVVVWALLGVGTCFASDQQRLDDFRDISGWKVTASEGSSASVAQEPAPTGNAMRISFDLNPGGGYIIVRKEFSLALPANYAFTFNLRGDAKPNNFEFKLVDQSGKNVWWRRQRDFSFPTEWQRTVIRKSRIDFAWGPSGRELKRIAAIEFALSAGVGGKGSIWIQDLDFEEREPLSREGPSAPTVTASTSVPGHEPPLLLDNDENTSWKSQALPDSQWVVIDFHQNWEYGGLIIDWDPNDYATAYEVQTSNDGTHWTRAYAATATSGGRAYAYMPDAESRYVKLSLLRSSRGRGYAIATVAPQPMVFSSSPNQFFTAVAEQQPVGTYPKYFYGRQTYWTIVGVDGDGKSALLNEEGIIEVDKGAFSIEPFLFVDGKLITWSAVRTTQELEDGYLPIPSVVWQYEPLTLKLTAFASGKPGASTLYATYRVENHGEEAKDVQLLLAIRPFQVNPPWQSLNMNGGTSPIHEMRFDGRAIWVNRDKAIIPLPLPDRFGGTEFTNGDITDFLQRGEVPGRWEVSDSFGFASGALQYRFVLGRGKYAEVDLAVPFHEPYVAAAVGLDAANGRYFIEKQHDDTRRYWQRLLNRVEFQVPAQAEKTIKSVKTALAYALISRDGPAIQPGTRDYARSWIRDGALTAAALLQMGCTQQVEEFIRWYAGYQFPDGKVPCCIDRRGPDPASEHDSPGEFIYAIAEYYRFTHDIGFVYDMWPHIEAAVDYLLDLRRKRQTASYRNPDKLASYGLLPESISHEGYSSQPVHSYWDDFFALRGFKDAALLADVVGNADRAASLTAVRDEFRHDLRVSLYQTMANHNIDYIPGSVELGDFDPTSTAIALSPGHETATLPQPALTRTFERYYDDFTQRRTQSAESSAAYSPYEVRNVAVFVRLGQRQRALELLDYIIADQRPPGWNEWAEVVWHDPTAPNFIGDMPHTWVGSTFLSSVRAMFAYEREADNALVIAGGLPSTWVTTDPGVAVKRFPTRYGVLSYKLRREGSNALLLQISGDLVMPPGGLAIEPPLPQPLLAVMVNGKATDFFTDKSVTIREFPAEVLLEY